MIALLWSLTQTGSLRLNSFRLTSVCSLCVFPSLHCVIHRLCGTKLRQLFGTRRCGSTKIRDDHCMSYRLHPALRWFAWTKMYYFLKFILIYEMYFFHTYASSRAFLCTVRLWRNVRLYKEEYDSAGCFSKLKERLIVMSDIIYLSVMYLMLLSVVEIII